MLMITLNDIKNIFTVRVFTTKRIFLYQTHFRLKLMQSNLSKVNW